MGPRGVCRPPGRGDGRCQAKGGALASPRSVGTEMAAGSLRSQASSWSAPCGSRPSAPLCTSPPTGTCVLWSFANVAGMPSATHKVRKELAARVPGAGRRALLIQEWGFGPGGTGQPLVGCKLGVASRELVSRCDPQGRNVEEPGAVWRGAASVWNYGTWQGAPRDSLVCVSHAPRGGGAGRGRGWGWGQGRGGKESPPLLSGIFHSGGDR